MTSQKTNLVKLRASRRRPAAGDYFVVKLRGHPYIWGRVADVDVKLRGFVFPVLCLFFDIQSESLSPIPSLGGAPLLIPPKLTNYLGWSRGYFEFVMTGNPADREIAREICFRDMVKGGFRDRRGRRIDARQGPCGTIALSSYLTIDDDLSLALGIPPVEDCY